MADSIFSLEKSGPEVLNDLLYANHAEVIESWKALDWQTKDQVFDVIDPIRSTTRRQMLAMVEKLSSDKKLRFSPLTVYVIAEAIASAKTKQDLNQKLARYRIVPGDYKLSEIKPYFVNALDVLNKLYLVYSYPYAAIYLQIARIFTNNNISLDKDTVEALVIHNASFTRICQWYKIALATASVEHTDEEITNQQLIDSENPIAAAMPSEKMVFDLKRAVVELIAGTKVFPRALINLLKQQDDVSVLFVFVNAIMTAAQHPDKLDEVHVRLRVANVAIVQDIIHLNNQWLAVFGNSVDPDRIR